MSIEHKAWLLDYKAFHDELAGILFRALDTSELAELAAFIDTHHASMTDPWTWEPLPANWRAVLKERSDQWNAQTLGEVALTRYYDVTENVGLSYGFDAVHVYLKSAPALSNRADALIGGYGFGPRGKRFDPGCMGTGFVTPTPTWTISSVDTLKSFDNMTDRRLVLDSAGNPHISY